MLRVLGSAKTLCDSLTRREVLRVGGLGTFSLSLADLWALQEAQAAPETVPASATANTKASFGRAKRIILLYFMARPPSTRRSIRNPRRRPKFAAFSSRSTRPFLVCKSASTCRTWPASPTAWPSSDR